MRRTLQYFALITFVIFISCTNENIDLEGPQQPQLREWLDENTSLKNALRLEQDSSPSFYFGGSLNELSYDDWSEDDKTLLDQSFARAWQNIYQPQLSNSHEFAMPLDCTYCEERLVTHPNNGPFTVIPESLSKTVYLSHVAYSLALEAGSGLDWSIVNSDQAQLHTILNSRSMMHRLSGTTQFFFGEPGGGGDSRIKYIGRWSPATPDFIYQWAKAQSILRSTQEETVIALLQWLRENAIHFYGSATYQNMQEHWGYPGQTSIYHIINGTIRDTENTTQHWTAGCHGTVGFVKSVLRVLNIPVETIYTCGHGQLYFPTLGRYLDHGDNPYNSNVTTQDSKNVSGILVDETIYTQWFSSSPDYLDPANPLCNNIGRSALEF